MFPEGADKGKCLSMLQPWASLLIEGFKRFEGRFWNTEYRGPLWIHAGANPPTPETVKTVEGECAEFYKNCEKRPNFPERYPLGSLLGMVDLQTVLKREIYEEVIPKEFREKTESEHLFVVRNPKRLLYPIKMPGNKDIYDLHPEIRKAALNCLQKVKTNWWPYYAQNLTNNRFEKFQEEPKKLEVSKPVNENKEERKSSISEQKPEEIVIKKIWKNRGYQNKKEKFGFSVQDFFEEDNLRDIIFYIEEKSFEMKNMTNKNVAVFNYDISFPYYEQLGELFKSHRKNIKLQNMKTGNFYINKKQKAFEFEAKYRIVLNIGYNVTLTVMNEEKDETNQFDLMGGSFYFVPERCRVSFQNSSEIGAKKKLLKGDCINLFVLFSEA